MDPGFAKEGEGMADHNERGVRAYNEGLGTEPPLGFRGRASSGSWEEAPKAESFISYKLCCS